MEYQRFIIIYHKHLRLCGVLRDGCLDLTSTFHGPGYANDYHYAFSREQTEKLLSVCGFDAFVELCCDDRISGMEAFLDLNGIGYSKCKI